MAKAKKPYFGAIFGVFPEMRFFLQNSALLVFDPEDHLTSCKISEKSYKLFLGKTVNWHID